MIYDYRSLQLIGINMVVFTRLSYDHVKMSETVLNVNNLQ